MVFKAAPGTEKTHVCLICLKWFGVDAPNAPENDGLASFAAVPLVDPIGVTIKAEPGCENEELDASLHPSNLSSIHGVPSENVTHQTGNVPPIAPLPPDNYARFLHFSDRYLKLRTNAELLSTYHKELRKGKGPNWKVEAFCVDCEKTVGTVCDQYADIKERQLRLLGKLSDMGKVMKRVSGKLEWGLVKTVAKQLNVKSTTQVFQFRKALQIKFKSQRKSCGPRVLVHRGLFPEQWKFTYAATKQALIRLIVVFGLAIAPKLKKPDDLVESEAKVVAETTVTPVPSIRRRGRPRKKTSATLQLGNSSAEDDAKIAVKKEVNEEESEGIKLGMGAELEDDNDGPPSPAASGGDSDPDWAEQDGPVSPASNASSNFKDNPESDPDFEEKPLTRRRRGRLPRSEDSTKKKYNVVNDHLKCPKCPGKEFKGYRGLRKHMVAKHNVHTIPYPCKICGAVVNNNLEMRDHMVSTHFKRKREYKYALNCEKCPEQTFSSSFEFHSHMKSMHNETPKFPCSECDKVLNTLRELHKHRKRFHAKPPKHDRFECPKCPGKSFVGFSKLRMHSQKVHNEVLSYPCREPDCNFRAETNVEMSAHRRAFHPDSFRRRVRRNKVSRPQTLKLRDRECETCSEIFQTLKQLNEHRKIHYTGKEGFRWNPPKKARKRLERPRQMLTEEEVKAERKRWKYCEICDKYELSPFLLRKHLEEQHEKEDDKPLLCYFCHRRFTVQKTLDLHCNAAHTRYTKYIFNCDAELCEMSFRTWGELHEHLKWHVGEIETKNDSQKTENDGSDVVGDNKTAETKAPSNLKVYYCTQCNFGCLNESLVDVHKINHIEKVDGSYHCPQCTATFATLALITRHYNMIHGGHVLVHQCKICEQRCFSRRSLFRHMRRYHKEGEILESSVTCEEPDCGETFSCLKYLAVHVQKRHKSTPKHACEICGKLFIWPSLVKLHMRSHKEPEFECNICHAKFKRRLIMERHRTQVHQQEDDPEGHLKCEEPDCNKRFTSTGLLRRHLHRVHNKGRVYQCEECGAVFYDRSMFSAHEKIHQECKFRCDICHKMFRRAIMVKYHQMRMHNKHRVPEEYICAECGVTYISETGLRFHIDSKHTPESEKRFPCPYCPKRFHRKGLLYQHVKNCKKKAEDAGEKIGEEPVLPPIRKRRANLNPNVKGKQKRKARSRRAANEETTESISDNGDGEETIQADDSGCGPSSSTVDPMTLQQLQYSQQPITAYPGTSENSFGMTPFPPEYQQQSSKAATRYPQQSLHMMYPMGVQNSANSSSSEYEQPQNLH